MTFLDRLLARLKCAVLGHEYSAAFNRCWNDGQRCLWCDKAWKR